MKSKSPEIDQSTEEKIKQAARELFQTKGFSATRSRDIATKAGINLALLNYYFRSKEKLFNIIILETMQEFFLHLSEMLNDGSSSFEEKINKIVANYIELLTNNPDIPIFILSEIRQNPEELLSKFKMKEALMRSNFMFQLKEGIERKEYIPINPLHFIMNLLGMLIFPFIASPMLKKIGELNKEEFLKLMNERKNSIPVWILNSIKTNPSK
ncbi:MAG: TetR/AcrR family transcriptional regulator [Flavobacteriales bacterium]|nr:TetR/AcrR family transcriptional regulator [Flavobacteriales bacterium]